MQDELEWTHICLVGYEDTGRDAHLICCIHILWRVPAREDHPRGEIELETVLSWASTWIHRGRLYPLERCRYL